MKRKTLEVDKHGNWWIWPFLFFFKKTPTLYIKQCFDESSITNCVIITHELFKISKKIDKI
jgi:hypothetical protein